MRSLAPILSFAPRLAQPPRVVLCRQCLRPISTTPALPSGHNKWSKIRHRKGAADAQKNVMRSQVSKNIALQCKLNGPDSPQLAAAVTAAKKAGVPKNVIEGAVARGQGRSATGAALDALTLEAIMPPGVALIIDIETDSRLRSLEDLKHVVKKHKGRVSSSAAFLFTRRGRVVFDGSPGTSDAEGGWSGGEGSDFVPPSADDVMEEAIEAGAEDLEADTDGNVVVWTQPNMTSAVAVALGPRFAGHVLSSEIIWAPNEETRVKVDSAAEAQSLADLLAALQEYTEVQAIYANAARGSISDELWSNIEDGVDS